MKNLILFCVCALCAAASHAQKTLPNISVKNVGKATLISWRNAYTKPISVISIQRSYDSLRNFTTIGSVLDAQNEENGFADNNAPYNNMYYRALITFEGGAYIYSPSTTPEKYNPYITVKTADGRDSLVLQEQQIVYEWQKNPFLDSNLVTPPKPNEPVQSQRIFASKESNVVLHVENAAAKKYIVKFYNENNDLIFQLNRIPEDYLIIEKVNFVRSGLYHFEIYEDGKLIETNTIFVPKDSKNNR